MGLALCKPSYEHSAAALQPGKARLAPRTGVSFGRDKYLPHLEGRVPSGQLAVVWMAVLEIRVLC